MAYLFVGIGGGLGAMARYALSQAFSPLSSGFPAATLLINFIGALVIGLVTELSQRLIPLPPSLLLFLTTGLCGGFTTFSTFSLETINLFEKGRIAAGFSYAAASVLLCAAGVLAGKGLIRLFAR